jgi:hypothetical protein
LWESLHTDCRKAIGPATIERLAHAWHVTPEALRRLDIGFHENAYTFPMKSARGDIVGIHKRSYDNPTVKYALTGSVNGLFLPAAAPLAAAARRQKPEVIAEGASDLAAALTAGVCGVGRPGAHEATAEIVALFQEYLTACPCIVGDNDAEGQGEKGAEDLAAALVAAGVPCRVLLPPRGIKDLREWCARENVTAAALRTAIGRRAIRWPADDPPGFVRLPNRLLRRGMIAKAGPGPFALACVIQSFYAPGHEARPSRETLAELLGVTPATVDRWKRVLEESGLVCWRRGGTRRANGYAVNFGPLRNAGGHEAAHEGHAADTPAIPQSHNGRAEVDDKSPVDAGHKAAREVRPEHLDEHPAGIEDEAAHEAPAANRPAVPDADGVLLDALTKVRGRSLSAREAPRFHAAVKEARAAGATGAMIAHHIRAAAGSAVWDGPNAAKDAARTLLADYRAAIDDLPKPRTTVDWILADIRFARNYLAGRVNGATDEGRRHNERVLRWTELHRAALEAAGGAAEDARLIEGAVT